jgi:4-amino-4-deoxychorismate lyase
MSLLLESIRIEDGRVMNPGYHIERMKRSVVEAGFHLTSSFPGEFITSSSIPPHGIHKCRVLYNSSIISTEISRYERKEIRTLMIVEAPRPRYALKYADRSEIDALFAQRGECDDILIVSDGVITDTSYCNVAFEKDGRWFTPASPLLKGTMRQFLLDSGVLAEEEILLSELRSYGQVRLFNAMIPWERTKGISIF